MKLGIHALTISDSNLALDGFQVQGCTGYKLTQRSPGYAQLTLDLIVSTPEIPGSKFERSEDPVIEPHQHSFWADLTTGETRFKCCICGKVSLDPTFEEVIELIQGTSIPIKYVSPEILALDDIEQTPGMHPADHNCLSRPIHTASER